VQTISPPDLAHRLRPVIARLGRRMRQEAGGELSLSQGAALTTIACHGPLTPSELATRERIQRPTATRVLARLEEAGLLQRAADPADGRSSLISATPAGHALLAAQRERKDAYLARQLDGLAPEELAALDRAAAILERVLAEGSA
jgi:DNA-binding MarR family transcriptional regulator